jgi:XTP/dITP diphosphohydrolase
MLPELLVATHNAGKVREIRQALGNWVGELRMQAEVPGAPPPAEETGATYRENALLKASALAQATGLPSMADDSGLEVEALGGRPGVHSSRYGSGDAGRIARLLAELSELPGSPARRARFVCTVALVLPGQAPVYFEGTVGGTILETPRGDNGFGFDPVFLVEGLDQTMAELPLEHKNRISHRARALQALREWLQSQA